MDACWRWGAYSGRNSVGERANWFATEGMEQRDHWSFRRSRWFEAIKKETLRLTARVGLLDMTPVCQMSYLRARRRGPFWITWSPTACRVKTGQIRLCHALNRRGGVHSEFTILREADDSFYLVSAVAWLRLDHDYLHKYMPTDGSVTYEHLTDSIGVFVVAGPAPPDAWCSVCPGMTFPTRRFPFSPVGRWSWRAFR